MSHQLVMMHAFHYKHHALNAKILILEEDALRPERCAVHGETTSRAPQTKDEEHVAGRMRGFH